MARVGHGEQEHMPTRLKWTIWSLKLNRDKLRTMGEVEIGRVGPQSCLSAEPANTATPSRVIRNRSQNAFQVDLPKP